MPCTETHDRNVDESELASLTRHQMHDHGRHKCCQCAYNSGYQQGLTLQTTINLDIENLGDSQASSEGRHRSVHQAFALGYSHGIEAFILNQ